MFDKDYFIRGNIMTLKLMYITNNSDVALIAEKYGVNRIWIDLETLGKEERQKGMNTVKSKHSIEDIKKIKPLLSKSELLVRINPWNENSIREINDVVSAGADIIMLPMWKSSIEVSNFINTVGNRCKTTLLLETKEAVECLDEVLKNYNMDEIHIGLNDLHLSYGMTFMFELLANGTVEKLIQKIKTKGIPYGFGGIARLGEGDLSAEKIIMEHYRLGSTRVILSRSFCNADEIKDISYIEKVFRENIRELHDFEKKISYISDFSKNQNDVKITVEKIVSMKKEKKMYFKVRRVIDTIIALLMLFILLPVLLIIALWIKIDSKGTVIFKQKRIGKNGISYDIYKFRTMVQDAQNMGTGVFSFAGDPRITKVGAFLRKTSLDELPQLWNIVKGDMAFVGPRSPVVGHFPEYNDLKDEYKKRFSVLPGITGLAQCVGRNELPWDEKVVLDNQYIDNVKKYGIIYDIKIWCMTFKRVFSMNDVEESAENMEKSKIALRNMVKTDKEK